MGSGGADHAGDVQGQDVNSVDSVGKDGPHTEREEGVQGHRSGIGAVEGLIGGG